MISRLWLILLLALSGLPRPAVAGAPAVPNDGTPACCRPVATPPPAPACCTPAPSSCAAMAAATDAATDAATCHRSGGPCRCGVRPDAPGPPTPPAAPAPSSSRDAASAAPAAVAPPPVMTLAATAFRRVRPTTDARAIAPPHLQTRAQLGTWRT